MKDIAGNIQIGGDVVELKNSMETERYRILDEGMNECNYVFKIENTLKIAVEKRQT